MKKLQKDLQSAAKALASVVKKLDAISQQVERLGKAQSAPKPKPTPPKKTAKPKAAKKAVKVTCSDTVLQFIGRSKKPVDMAAIEKKTGFNKKKIQNIVFTLRKQGKINNAAKGLYEKA
jgi:predicted Rossmann fold nucleotide-binding protein DprA/Smf involved in DNA uptake